MSTSQKDLVILLIGPSGSGKSSFVKSLTSEKVRVDSRRPCTDVCKAYRVQVKINAVEKTFILVDTPGFVDSPDENLDTLENIADTLAELKQEVFGAIYFHNITEVRMKGTSLAVLDVFKAMCGREFFPHMAFVTTMWDTIHKRFHDKLDVTHTQLINGPMRVRDSVGVFKRSADDVHFPNDLLGRFCLLAWARPAPPPLHLIQELRDGARGVASTSAGRRILKDDRTGPSTVCCTIM